jgi:hypothetical protein
MGADAGGDDEEGETASGAGRTKIGLKLGTVWSVAIATICGTLYRKASHKISTHETQLETMISPACGCHASMFLGCRLYVSAR